MMGDRGSVELRTRDSLFWIQAHRAAAQAVVGTVLGARVLSLELQDGPPPVGVLTLGEPDPDNADAADHGLVRLLAYRVAGPIAERVAECGGTPLQGEPAYRVATAVMALLHEPDAIDDETDAGQVARLLLDHFGARESDASEAVEHLAINVEQWVCDHWGAIAIVAVDLLRHRRLTGDAVRRLMPPLQVGALA